MADARDAEQILRAWMFHDAEYAVHPKDRELLDATRAHREAVVDAVLTGLPGRDLFQACADLGRYLADHGASPTFAAATLEGAHVVLAARATAPWGAMRAALAEGYAAGLEDAAQRSARDAWEYPRCVTDVDRVTIAIVAGFPADDGEALAAWCDRVARAAVKDGVRRALVGGGTEETREALRAALETAGITIVRDLSPPAIHAESPSPARWFRLWPRARERHKSD